MDTTSITTPTELDELPHGSVVRSDAGTIAARYNEQHGTVFGDDRPFPWAKLRLPVTLLHVPGRDLLAEAKAEALRQAAARPVPVGEMNVKAWLHQMARSFQEARR